MLLAWGIAVIGLGLAVVATLQARAGRLSTGHGTAWALCGVTLLLAGGVMGLLGGARTGFPAGGAIALLAALAFGLAFGVAHAISLSRLNERVKRLAQEVALLRAAAGAAAGEAGAAEAGGAKDRAPRAG